jgi:hypothetical protein
MNRKGIKTTKRAQRLNGTAARLSALETAVEDLKVLMCARFDNIEKSVDRHEDHVSDIYKQLLRFNQNMSLFKGKVIGVAAGVSAVFSIVIPLLILALRS